ncbi:glycosyltransferase [candidate division KSB1 bacterium]|nr:glycosyltransferase [candidate division KSB1 bacterium]
MTLRVLMIPGGGLDNGSARTRMYAYLPALAAAGVAVFVDSYTFHKYERGTERPRGRSRLWLELLPLRALFTVFRADAIWHQKFSGGRIKLGLARALRKRIVYDLDDAIYLASPFDLPNAVWRSAERERVNRSLRRASAVVASGAAIRRYATGLNAYVHVIPTIVETVAAAPSVPRHPAVVGWVGAPENQRFLRPLEDSILRLQAELPELEVWIMTSGLMNPPPRYRHRFIPWSRSAEAEFVPQFTLGLAPLDDTEWCRAKMNYKALVYMSRGVPAVASPIGFPVQDFADRDSIRYASAPEEWYEAMKQLLSDGTARDRLADRALLILRDRYTADSRASELLAVLQGG